MILILSSLVAASAVGGSAQAAALQRRGVETMLIPTVLFGRHPGLGAPGGGPVPQELLDGVIAGMTASGALARVDAMIAGYFASADQVMTGARLIDGLRQANAEARIVVDPIMGDEEAGLYVTEAVATALARELVPGADLICPNAWELARLTGQAVSDVGSALSAARACGQATLVSSVSDGRDIGALFLSGDGAFLATHARAAEAPKGTGDLLAAVFTAAWLRGAAPAAALAEAVQVIADLVLGPPARVQVRRIA